MSIRDRPAPAARSSYITPEGARRLRDELDHLWKVERPRVTQAVSDAAALGDRSENADYIYGKRRLREIDRRVRFLTKRLDEITIVREPPTDPSRVFFGAWVAVEDDDGAELEYRIVGADESDLEARLISVDSPVARALLGKRAGDAVTVRRPKGDATYTITGVPVSGASGVTGEPSSEVVPRRRRRATETPLHSKALVVTIPPTLRRYTGNLARWRDGNRVTHLVNGGQAFPAMLKAIEAATRSICLETYILEPDHTGKQFAAALIARARAGVTVRLLYDAVGGFGVTDAYVAELTAVGIEVVVFHPIAPWRKRFNLSRRDHRKILVVDDEVAFTGGLNISDHYADVADGGKGWRDTHCELRGPVVADLARTFRRTWLYAGGKPYRAPPPAEKLASTGGSTLARLLDNAQRRRRRRIRRAYLTAINAAEKQILIENAYFLPDRGVRAALRRAVGRGVEVRVLAPGRSDVRLIELASLLVFRRLASAGIVILRWRGVMMHCKTAVIDAVWSTIGSYNLDYISLLYNLEATIELLDPDHGALMVQQFERDAANADRFDEATWLALPWWRKFGAWLAFQVRRWL